ncbi:MAG: hypothetical protein KatS3mg006_0660 [Pyrinomonadaceae bacterium]|nr:MAG: hypothetical protein KatS3mg006_0660 [Pyrinomonadaceae bacterium]
MQNLDRRFSFSFLLLLVLVFVSFSKAQTALEIARKTIKASGGEVWRSPSSLQLEGTAVVYWFDQPRRLVKYKMWRVFPRENNSAHTANGKVRFDAFEAGDRLFFQISFDGEKTYQNLSPSAREKQEFLRWGNNFGFSIFRFIENEGFKLELLPEDKVDGHPCYFVKVIDPSKTETIFGIDKKSFFIRYAGFRTPIGFHERIYDNFVRDEKTGFIQPLHLRIFNDGIKTTEVFWKTFKVNEPISDEVFIIETP